MKLPRISASKVIRVLKKKGFKLVRQSGSHLIFRNENGIRVTVPQHSGKTLHPKILRSIMRDSGIGPEDF